MELNSIIFRPPVPSYTYSRFEEEMIWIPGMKKSFIPCLFLHSHQQTQKTFLFLHANAEDLGKIYDFLDIMRCVIEVNILAPEYPGYGLNNGKASCKNVLNVGLHVYRFALETLRIKVEDLIIIGRSIGTCPATCIAGEGAAALVLLSPFTSLRKLIKRLVGTFLSYIVKDQYRNIDYIKKVICPVLMIHGKKDALIPFSHSEKLAKACQGQASVILSDTMSHNKFEYYDDVLSPIDNFLKENSIEVTTGDRIYIPEEFYKIPEIYMKKQEILRDFL
ncbi:hypothetical protein SteCoe_20184 [Stentor coeruleus]|uniref:Serine hydrolase domain-containing protein n=1 Tax=Stentor coeruleus TaxID=5963 RepID=A0A1R2BSS1_9CILI|nr:hypothetical protein SteCoe_20184 [Stentor coeruleus]